MNLEITIELNSSHRVRGCKVANTRHIDMQSISKFHKNIRLGIFLVVCIGYNCHPKDIISNMTADASRFRGRLCS